MLDDIVSALKANAGVHDWQVRKVRTVQHELYLIGTSVESRRSASSESAVATLYHDREGKRGSATLTFAPGETDDLAVRVERGVYVASLAGNPPHALPGPSVQPDVPLRDSDLAGRPKEVIESWRTTLVRAVEFEPQVRLSASEFFVYDSRIDFLNSRGACYSYPATRASIELVLLSRDGGLESENYHSLEARATKDVDLAAVVRERASFARDRLRVDMPKTRTCPVVISGEPLGGLFDPFLWRVNAQALYRGIFKTKSGDNLLNREPVGDPFELSVDPTVAFGVRSAPVDGEGLPARRLDVLRGGRVERILASKRFADYLGIEATGTSGNTVVASGTLPEAELLQGPVIHLVSFADLRPNPMTGEFVTEIRLGYEIESDGTRRPVKGGSVAGNVFDAFADCRMSRETIRVGGYHGPRSIRFGKLVISGE